MIVSKQLQKQIIVEIIALIFLIGAIIYAILAINNNGNQVLNDDGMVIVLDDENFKALESLSDGEGLSSEGIKYTVTNNNEYLVRYKLILKLNEKPKNLKHIRVGVDDLFIDDLLNLAEYENGYMISSGMLNPGYTKIHTIKLWYALAAEPTQIQKEIDYKIELVRE